MKFLVILAATLAVGGAAYLAPQPRASINLPPHISAIIQSLLSRPEVIAVVQSSALYQCLKAELGLVGDSLYAHLQGLNQAGNLNAHWIANSPAVAECLAQQGGLENMIQNSAIIATIRQFIAALGLQEDAQAIILHVAGPHHGQNIVDILNQSGRASINLPPHISAAIQQILSRPEVDAVVQSSTLYQCLKVELGLEGNSLYAHLQELNQAGNLNLDFLINSPAVNECVDQQGGLEGLIGNSPIIAQAQGIIAALNMTTTVHGLIIHFLGEELGGHIVEILEQNQRSG